ncbi:Csu type fimbrial protein [Pseudomonas sp. MDT1-17]
MSSSRWLSHLSLWKLVAFWLPAISTHAAINCSIAMSPLSFGNINVLTASAVATATLSYSCTNTNPQPVHVNFCANIGNGGSGLQGSNRLMSGPSSSTLQFQLYRDSARTQLWGSMLSSVNPTPYNAIFVVSGNGTTSGSATLYGQVIAAQPAPLAGNYNSSFGSSNDAVVTIQTANGNSNAPASCGQTVTPYTFPFTVTANITNHCLINAVSALNFGSQGLLSAAVYNTATLTTQCTNGTPYSISLDNGLNANGAVRRMLGPNSELLTYELYRDSNRTLRWGSIVNTDTLSVTGNGSPQVTTVYGLVPAQITPPPGTYSDTVTVSVTY